MIYLIAYIAFGLGFYTAAAMINFRFFERSDLGSIILGFVFGLLLWPLAITTYPFWRK